MKLTERQREILKRMVDHRDDSKGELVRSIPGGWWIGTTKVSGPTAFFFLRHALISKDQYSDKSMEIYRANSYARRALEDPDFDIMDEME